MVANRINNELSSKLCCLTYDLSPSRGSTSRHAKESSTKITIVACHPKRSDTVKKNWIRSPPRSKGNGPRSYWPNWGKIFVRSTESTSWRRLRGRCRHVACFPRPTRKAKCVALTAFVRQIKFGDWIWSWLFSFTHSRWSLLTERSWEKCPSVAIPACAFNLTTSKSLSRNWTCISPTSSVLEVLQFACMSIQ